MDFLEELKDFDGSCLMHYLAVVIHKVPSSCGASETDTTQYRN